MNRQQVLPDSPLPLQTSEPSIVELTVGENLTEE